MRFSDLARGALLAFVSLMAVAWSVYNLVPYYGIVHGLAYPVLVLTTIAMLWFSPRMPRAGLVVVTLLILAVMAIGGWEAIGARGITGAGRLFSVALIPLFFMPLLYTALESRKGTNEKPA